MVDRTRWDDYGPEPHEGWEQVGNKDGRKYAVWKPADGSAVGPQSEYAGICRGNDSLTGRLGGYWAKYWDTWDEQYCGEHETFEQAEAALAEALKEHGRQKTH